VPDLITLTDIHKHYGPNAILEGASVAFSHDHRVAVIGRNGAGKSTMCRMIIGTEEADAGTISRHDELRLSWLEQQSPFLAGETGLGFLERWSGREDWACARLAARFMLTNQHLDQAVDALSGGLQTRLRLAAMMLREPNFLILDEPTNYLDLRTLILLEEFLTSWRGGYLIVSHDREFLKRTCHETLEVANGQATFFPGPLEDYLAHKELRLKEAEHHNLAVDLRRKQLQEFIAKNKAKASKATQAASKSKMLERLHTIEVEHAAAEAVIRIPAIEVRKGPALRVKNLSIGYGERLVASGIDLEIDRGSRVAVVGDNGQGKSTLLKSIAGSIPPLGGIFSWGHAMRVGAYAQHVYAAIDERTTVQKYLEKCAAAAPGHVTSQQILDIAGGFLFRGSDVEKKVAVLSGGERARLCLAGLLLGRHETLLLDEPTNHLDFETVEALAEALATYQGTIFFTSHDRTFVSLVATHIVDVRDQSAKLYPDDYASYVWRIEKEVHDEQEAGAPTSKAKAPPKAGAAPAAGGKPKDGPAVQEKRKRCQALEKVVARLEMEQNRLSASLSSERGDQARQTGQKLAQVTRDLGVAETAWFALQAELEGRG